PLRHRGPCYAYRITLARRGKFDPERAARLGVPMKIWSALQKQNEAEIVYDGKKYTSDMVLGKARRGLGVAYCTDTRPTERIAPFVSGADLFICEGLYGSDAKKAAQHMHMSFGEAATVAKKAGVFELWLTHFSPALPDPHSELKHAAGIFGNTVIGRDRMTKTLRFIDDPEDD
ncbi:MAG: MBL fold metallo-hydrolase, partial [Defluviitaleaceae bacterium]|nr:MBL fold metallo-hydrolase [Defluviitaleaceae bacterium]